MSVFLDCISTPVSIRFQIRLIIRLSNAMQSFIFMIINPGQTRDKSKLETVKNET